MPLLEARATVPTLTGTNGSLRNDRSLCASGPNKKTPCLSFRKAHHTVPVQRRGPFPSLPSTKEGLESSLLSCVPVLAAFRLDAPQRKLRLRFVADVQLDEFRTGVGEPSEVAVADDRGDGLEGKGPRAEGSGEDRGCLPTDPDCRAFEAHRAPMPGQSPCSGQPDRQTHEPKKRKRRARPVTRTAFAEMVEVAGFEPASLVPLRTASTCLAPL